MVKENNVLVIIVTSPDQYTQAFLMMDGKLIGKIKDIELVPVVLLASYVFNICYPKELHAFYSILEVTVLNTHYVKSVYHGIKDRLLYHHLFKIWTNHVLSMLLFPVSWSFVIHALPSVIIYKANFI